MAVFVMVVPKRHDRLVGNSELYFGRPTFRFRPEDRLCW